MVMKITEVLNHSKDEVLISCTGKDDITLKTYGNKYISWEVPQVADADYWNGITIYRSGDSSPSEKVHFWDQNYNLKFRDEFSGAVNTYALHINVHWFKNMDVKIIVLDQGFIIKNDSSPPFLGYYPENADGSSAHAEYSIQPGTNGTLIVAPE